MTAVNSPITQGMAITFQGVIAVCHFK